MPQAPKTQPNSRSSGESPVVATVAEPPAVRKEAKASPTVPDKPRDATAAPSQPPAPPKKSAAPARTTPEEAKTSTGTAPLLPAPEVEVAAPAADPAEDPAAAENADANQAAVAKPVSPDPVQIFGWREHVRLQGVALPLLAKLDTGALTSSIHAEEKELFERDGKKWVRFIVTDPREKKPVRTRIEAPLVRIARIKEPGAESMAREVVRLSFQIGDRRMRGEFTLNNRSNMLAPILIGRSIIKDLGWVDPSRTHLAEQKIFR